MSARAAALVLAIAACGPNGRHEPARSATREEAPMSGATSPTGEPHPGEIVNVDKVEGRTWTRKASEVPASVAWVKVGDQWKAVVRIEITGAGDRREVTKLGADGELLETTMATLGPPPATPARKE
jgi:hypothetical protein